MNLSAAIVTTMSAQGNRFDTAGIVHGGEPIFTCEKELQSLTAWGRYLHGQHRSRTGRSFSLENFGQPRIGKLARWDGQPSGKGMPDYPIEFSAPSHHTRSLLEVKYS